jgi:hypothetical protein
MERIPVSAKVAPSSVDSAAGRTELLSQAYRGRRVGFLHDYEADQARRRVWSAIAESPADPELSVGREALIQSTLALIPGIVLAGTHLRGKADAKVLRHWQATGRRPRGYAFYRLSGVLQTIGTLVTGLATLGLGIAAAYWILKRQSERLHFARPAGSGGRRGGKGRKRSGKRRRGARGRR